MPHDQDEDPAGARSVPRDATSDDSSDPRIIADNRGTYSAFTTWSGFDFHYFNDGCSDPHWHLLELEESYRQAPIVRGYN